MGKLHIDIDSDKSFDHDMLKKIFVYCNDCNYNYSINSIEGALMGDPTETALIKGFFKSSDVEALIAR